MSVKKIVLTGGPCAGKSTGLAVVRKRLEELGYTVIIMSEMATDVMNSGLNASKLGPVKFQELLLKMQLNRDFLYKSFLKDDDKTIILYDRGIIDGFAYCNYDDFMKILQNNNKSYYELMNFYDAVFHLTTAAIGAEKYYTLENNPVRFESIDDARFADARTLKAWLGHPHLRVIDNEGVNFEGKMNHLLKEIMSFLGEPEPHEKERKFFIRIPEFIDNWEIGVYEKYGVVSTPIIQTYLISDDENKERRIRQRGFVGDYSYYYTEKIKVDKDSTFERIEKERQISEREYNTLMMEAIYNLPSLHKDRYCFVYKNKYFELDLYPYWTDYAILEIETDDETGEIEMPDFIEVIKEVTNEKGFSNRELAEHSNDFNYLKKMEKLMMGD